MGQDIFTNNATGHVTSGGTSAPAALTTETWTVVTDTGTFPAASSSANPPTQFRVVDPAQPTEVILITNVSGTTFSATRGWEGTTPTTHASGFTIDHVITAAWLNNVFNYYDAKATFGCKGDGETVTDGAMTSGSATLTSSTAAFTASDVGKQVLVSAATSTSYTLSTKIVTVNSGTSVTVADPCRATQTAQTIIIEQGRSVADAVTTNDSTTVTSATAAFTSADVGRKITITGAGRRALATTISAYTNSTTVTLAASATRTCSSVQVIYGTDDTAALALAVGGSGNRQVYLPSGTYMAKPSVNGGGTPINISSNVKLFGNGFTSVIQAVGGDATTAGCLFGVNMYTGGTTDPTANTNNITIENLMVSGTAQEEGFLENAPNLLVLSAASDILVRNCKFRNFRSDAIYLGSGTDGTSERHNERIRIENCYFDGVNWANRNAISIVDGTDITIDRCYFTTCSDAGMPGAIDIEPNAASTFARINGIWVTNCYFTRIGGNVGVVGMDITIADSSLTNAAHGILVSGNTFYDNPATMPFLFWQAQTPTTSTRSNNIQIVNNDVYAAAGQPYSCTYIAEFEGVVGVEFSDNRITDSFSSIVPGYNLLNIDLRILNNTFQGCAIGGSKVIELVRANEVNIDGNLFYHCGDTLLRFQIGSSSAGSSDAVWFTNNTIRQGSSNATTTIASKNASHSTTATDNVFSGNSWPTSISKGDTGLFTGNTNTGTLGAMAAMLTATQSTTSTSAAVVPNLAVYVPAGTYLVELFLPYTASTTITPSLGITGPTKTAMNMVAQWGSSATAFHSADVTAYGVTALTSSTGTTTNLPFELSGLLTTSADGTVQAEFATSTGTITANIGSYLRLTPVFP